MNRRHVLGASMFALVGLLAGAGCGATKGHSAFQSPEQGGDDTSDASNGDDASGDDDSGTQPGSDDGFGKVKDAGADTGSNCITSVSGKVYDPAGNNALYNVVVYAPSKPVTAFKSGVACDTCQSLFSGAPVATTLTDAAGKFKLVNVPPGTNVPVVLQVGKWRRQITIPTVTACKDNPQADKTLRLPKNGKEGDIPNIAVSTGSADTLECLFKRMGFDDAEFVGGNAATGHIHIFQGSAAGRRQSPNTSPGGPSSSASLWDSAADIDKFDMVILSCEGAETTNAQPQVLYDYAAKGGRVFASHFHYKWFNQAPFTDHKIATWSTNANVIPSILTGGTTPGTIATKLGNGGTFPKGVAMQSWLGNVNALDANGKLPITYACHNADWTVANTDSTQWITVDDPLVDSTTNKQSASTTATEYLSFNMPFGAKTEAQCGKVVYSDLHVGSASGDDTGQPIPGECKAADLSPQEKALEFMLFDLAACVTPVDVPPAPPDPGIN